MLIGYMRVSNEADAAVEFDARRKNTQPLEIHAGRVAEVEPHVLVRPPERWPSRISG
jgi:hypothetical protein